MGSKTKVEEKESKDEDARMSAALVFVGILFVIGVPLWWHLTTVERVELPSSRIENLNRAPTYVRSNLSIVTSDDAQAQRLAHDLRAALQDSTILKYHIAVGQAPAGKPLTPEVLEPLTDFHPTAPGTYQLVLSPALESNRVLFGAHRTLYFSKSVDIPTLARAITHNLLQEPLLLQAKDAITPPEHILPPNATSSDATTKDAATVKAPSSGDAMSKETISKDAPSSKDAISKDAIAPDAETLRRVRLSSQFDLILTAIVPDPEHLKVEWDFAAATNGYIQPLLDQLASLSNYSVKSQWLYHVDLEQTPTQTNETYLISHKQMSHIVSSLENKLGSYASKAPAIHLVLYFTECSHIPLSFIDSNGRTSQSIISDRWGSIQLVNPSKENCRESKVLSPDLHLIMSSFLNDLKQELGVKREATMRDIDVVEYNAALLTDWEKDALYRIRTVEQITSAKLTLSSLIQLLDQISNIVITSQVGDAVALAVDAAEQTLASLATSHLAEALTFSAQAFNSSEFAFTHPSLLALLYFPDDQKYAVYIPLFLPVLIPVILSFHALVNWIKKKIPADILKHIQLPCIPDQTQLYDDKEDEKED